MNRKIIYLLTGGTGGHVIPAVSFGNYLVSMGFQCILITDKRGEKYTKNFLGKTKTINASHLSGGHLFNFFGLLKLLIGFFQSFLILLLNRPHFVVSFGSYASLPPSFSIKILKFFFNINFYIHEQNSIIGRANKFFFKTANIIFVNFNKNYDINHKYKHKIKVVGLPRINELNKKTNNLKIFDRNNKKFTIFLYGGSQGSIPLIKCFESLITRFNKTELDNISFIIQCPNFYLDELNKKMKNYKLDLITKDFFYNLSDILQNTDLVISRCGAGTISDIMFYKIPSILVPLSSAKDNHQYENANFLYKKKCAMLLNQNNFDTLEAYNYFKKIFVDNNIRNEIKHKLGEESIVDTNKIILDLIKNEIK